MKKFLSAIVLIVSFTAAFAQNSSDVVVRSTGYNEVQLSYTSPTLSVKEMQVLDETYSVLEMDGFYQSSTVGHPSLPVLSKMIEIPLCADVQVTVTASESKVYTSEELGIEHSVFPVQQPQRKSDTVRHAIVRNEQVYATNSFVGDPVVSVHKVGVARDRNLATVVFSPVQYNPVTGEVLYYSQVDVTITFVDADVAATNLMKERYHSPAFGIGTETLNVLPSPKDVNTSAPVRMLIVSHHMFRGHLDSYIEWKQRKGFLVTVAYTDSIGTTTTSIRDYILQQYEDATEQSPAPTYLLLVGDVAQVPAFNSRCTSIDNQHVTDLYYSTWTDGDNIPDCYYGRFSATSIAHLNAQVEKTLMYEQYTFEDPTFLDKAVLVAGVDAASPSDNGYQYGDPALDYVSKFYVNGDNGYSQVIYYKNNTTINPNASNVEVRYNGGYNNSSQSAALRQLYNQGAGWINYSAHGYWNEWSMPEFTVAHANSMSNTQKFGFMIGNCCLSSQFNMAQCLAEAVLRRGNYCGAVSYIGGSNSTYWGHDFCWTVGARSSIGANMALSYNASRKGVYDRLFHTHNESFSDWYNTAGSMIVAGNMAVEQYTTNAGFRLYYWEIYHVMGDPSVMPWLTQADSMVVDVPHVLSGATEVAVSSVPYAYVALTTDGGSTLLGAAYSDAQGNAVVNTSVPLVPGSYEVAVTAQQYRPVFTPLNVISPDGPFVVITEVRASDCIAGDTSSVDVVAVNLGTESASGVNATVSFTHPDAEMLTSSYYIGQMAPGDTVEIEGHFLMAVRPYVANGTVIPVTSQVEWSGCDSPSAKSTSVYVKAPAIDVDFTLSEAVLTPGDSIVVTARLANEGQAAMRYGELSLTTSFPMAQVTTQPYTNFSVVVNGNQQRNFTVRVDENMPENSEVTFYLVFRNEKYCVVDSVTLRCGDPVVEDFESGNFSSYAWEQGTYPWQIVTDQSYSPSKSARSKVSLGNSCVSEFSIDLNVTVADTISFYYKVSSEAGYDKFKFYLDDDVVLTESGDVDWRRFACLVPAGNHTIKFAYSKDGSVSSGSDCVWVDDITLPISGPSVDIVSDTTCQNSEYTYNGETINTSEIGGELYSYTDASGDHYLYLTVVAEPQVSIVANVNPVMIGRSVMLTASGANRYEWSTGETSETIFVTPESDMEISVVGYMGQCSGEATIDIETYANGIDDAEEVPVALAYPNPTTGVLNVSFSNMEEVAIFNALGQLVKRQRVESDAVQVNIQDCPNGVYFVRVSASDAVSTVRIIKR